MEGIDCEKFFYICRPFDRISNESGTVLLINMAKTQKKTAKTATKTKSNGKVKTAAKKVVKSADTKHSAKKSVSKSIIVDSKQENNSTPVSLSKLGKAKIRPKSEKE